jgi:hypothetical protein
MANSEWHVKGTIKVNGKNDVVDDIVTAPSAEKAKRVMYDRLESMKGGPVTYTDLKITSVRPYRR